MLVENYVQSPRLCLTTFLNCWSRNGHTKHNTTPLRTTYHITTHDRTTHRVRLASADHGCHDASTCPSPADVANGLPGAAAITHAKPRLPPPAPPPPPLHRCSPRHTPRSVAVVPEAHLVPVLDTYITGARHVSDHILYRC